MKSQQAISPTREENFSEWYQQIIKVADLAENSEVRGCMIIKPWGYALWENIQAALDCMLKETGHRNVYFPLFIPLNHLQREARHVKGFAKECAVVTHHRLKMRDGKLIPTAPLKEPLIVRPTSETIIGATFAKWIHSYRDLPILLNQWANAVRWEMRPRLFLRTAEFLWQEGHTVHATENEAIHETKSMLYLYETFARDYLALPVMSGEKTPSERFPGAVRTFCIETMLQDRKAIQAGTSHFFGQNFSRASSIQFQSRSGHLEYAWTTSWGVSTRLIGALIMAHSDDDGLVLPPRVAPTHVAIIPILTKGLTGASALLSRAEWVANKLRKECFCNQPIRVELDTRNLGNGTKKWESIKKGIPIRFELGPRELETDSIILFRRDFPMETKRCLPTSQALAEVPCLLTQIQDNLLARATNFRGAHTHCINSKREFYQFFTPQNTERPEIHGGFALVHWNGSANIEEQLKTDLKVTIRCIPSNASQEAGVCIFTGEPSAQRVLFAKSY